MHVQPHRKICTQAPLLLLALALGTVAVANGGADSEVVSYNRHIRPLLSDKCFLCHGPDESSRKAKLRLDQYESAVQKGAIVPGDPEKSELIERVLATDADEVMPPPETHKTVNAEEKELLRKWIQQGAKYEAHWAYQVPVKPEVPAGTNAVDYLVRKRLGSLGLQPSPEADRRTLARRLYFDLVGLPPTPEEVAAFERDASPSASRDLVEKLLTSAHYGERMAIPWLDVVRFADTIGYHSDNPRNVWPYRDYVIRAFNENKRFDVFTREQLAGDLLPGSGLEQKVGSAFNRLLLTTEEGGAQPKDYEYRMLTDRVRAVGTVWLGQTYGCAACHDHKFDPVTMKDFYSLGAVFADIQEPIIGQREPGMLVPDKAQAAEMARRQAETNRLKSELETKVTALEPEFHDWVRSLREARQQEAHWTALEIARAESAGGAGLRVQTNGAVLAEGDKPDKDTYTVVLTNLPSRIFGLRIDALPAESLSAKGPGRAGNGNFVITEVVLRHRSAESNEVVIPLQNARADWEQTLVAEENPYGGWVAAAVVDGDSKGDGLGWAILPEAGKAHHLALQFEGEREFASGDSLVLEIRQNHGKGSHTLGHFRVAGCTNAEVAAGPRPWPPPAELVALLDHANSSEVSQAALRKRFKETSSLLAAERKALATAEEAAADYEATIPRALVTVSTSDRRKVHILPRGDFLKEKQGPVMEPALPAYLVETNSAASGQPVSRLDLADWLTSRDNPLTARVTMNRLWKHFFGSGLSRVLDDLGSQGEVPPNQDLLDWLACEFMDSGWDFRHMVRLLVTSDAYRQTSRPNPEQRASDPYNREIASQSRWRLEAELVRDSALQWAGLLDLRIGGPSAKPYQPEGYWENLNFPTRTYEASAGGDQYRRGLYTWWQRSFLHPSLLAFDAPSREECVAERIRSNIPQQALVLLNDPTYVEASRAFGARILRDGGAAAGDRVRWAWRQALAREPEPEEAQALLDLQGRMERHYTGDPAAAKAFLGVGQSPVPEDLKGIELAAWSQVARVILNLHEAITRY